MSLSAIANISRPTSASFTPLTSSLSSSHSASFISITPGTANVTTTLSLNAWTKTAVFDESSIFQCNSEYQSWLDKPDVTTTGVVSTYVSTYLTYIPPADATPYTTLCDGYPRAHGSLYFGTVTESGPNATVSWTTTTTISNGLPSCTVNGEECDYLSTYYSSAQSSASASWSAAGSTGPSPTVTRPACLSASGTCDAWAIASTMRKFRNIGGRAGISSSAPCWLVGGPVEVAYWPPSVVGSPCSSRLTIASNGTAAQYASIFGTTLASPSVLVSVSTMWAIDMCGKTVGTPISNYLLLQRPNQISTQLVASDEGYWGGQSVNYGDWVQPYPASAYLNQPACFGNRTYDPYHTSPTSTLCSTFFDDIRPDIALPTDLLHVQDAWTDCSTQPFNNYISDPPISVTPISNFWGHASTTPKSDPDPTPAQPGAGKGDGPKQTASPNTGGAQGSTGDPGSGSNNNGGGSSGSSNNNDGINNGGSNNGGDHSGGSGQGVGEFVASGIGLDPPSNGGDPGAGGWSPFTVGSAGSQPIIAAPSGQGVVIGGTQTLNPGQTAVVAGVTVAAIPGAIIAGGTTMPVPQNGGQKAVTGAIIASGSSTMTALLQDGKITIGGMTMIQGQITVMNGQTISAGQNGMVVNGNTASFSQLNTATATIIGAVFAAGSSTVTAIAGPGGAMTINGQVLKPGQSTVINGHTIIDASSAMIVDGSTVAVSALPTGTVQFTIGSDKFTATRLANGNYVIDGKTLSIGKPAITLDGSIVSDGTNGLVVGTSTVADPTSVVGPTGARHPSSATGRASSSSYQHLAMLLTLASIIGVLAVGL